MSSRRVLIVDDQRDIRELLRASLEYLPLDLEIVDVPSGEEGMLVISRRKFDLLITDVRLAGMSGLELVHKVQRRNPDLKVILITGMTDSDVRQQVAEFGASAFFYKPVDIAEFQAAVVRALGKEETPQPEPPVDAATPPTEETSVRAVNLPDLLEKLLRELQARCIWISDEKGEVVIRLGEAPEAWDSDAWRRAISTALAAQAEITRLLGKPFPETYHFIGGVEYDLHLINLGWTYRLHLVSSRGANREETDYREALLKSVGEILSALALYLEGKTTGTADEMAEEALPGEEDVEQLDAAFQQVSQKRLGTQELNNFWEAVIDEEEADSSPESGSLSYEQARRLGLTPEE